MHYSLRTGFIDISTRKKKNPSKSEGLFFIGVGLIDYFRKFIILVTDFRSELIRYK